MEGVEKDEELILRSLRYILSKYFCFDMKDLDENLNLHTDLGLDSLDFVEMIMLIEDSFDIDFDEIDERSMSTIRDLVNLIKFKTEGKLYE